MHLFVRALVVVALASLVLAGVAIAAARDASATDGGTEMEFLAQYERIHVGVSTFDQLRAEQEPIDWFVFDALQSPSEVLIERATIADLAETTPHDGSLPAAYFGPPLNIAGFMSASGYGYGAESAVANMTGSPVDVIVG